MVIILILSSLGGIVTFATGVFLVIRAILRSIAAIGDNTAALNEVRKTLKEVSGTVDDHTIQLAVLHDRTLRP